MANASAAMERVAKVLEDRFFFAEDKVLRAQYDKLKREEENITALSKACGIMNTAILTELVRLNIRPETATAITLIPIIEVAWADGEIDPKERDAILRGVVKLACGDNDAITSILSEWLERRPAPELLDAWRLYMAGLCEVMSKESLSQLKTDLLDHARMVAEVAGGFLGLVSPVSPAEQAVLDKLETFLDPSRLCGKDLARSSGRQ